MERLTLSPRPKTLEKEKCLPAGDGLPVWESLPLYSKFPMLPNPAGPIKLCTTKLCEPVSDLVIRDFSDSNIPLLFSPAHVTILKRGLELEKSSSDQ